MIKVTINLASKDPKRNNGIFSENTTFENWDSIEKFLDIHSYFWEKYKLVYKDDNVCYFIDDSDENVISYKIVELID